MNTHTNGCLQYHVAVYTLTKLVMKKYLQLLFEQAMRRYLKKTQINLREWQKWQQLLILYINIEHSDVILEKADCIPMTTKLSTARETVTISYTRTHAS